MLIFFEYYGIGKTAEHTENQGEGGLEGGNTVCGNIAMLRTKLGLSHNDIMERPWILTQIESADFPWYNSKKKEDNYQYQRGI